MSVALTGIKPVCDRKFSLLNWCCVSSKSLFYKALKCFKIIGRCRCLVATEAPCFSVNLDVDSLFDTSL